MGVHRLLLLHRRGFLQLLGLTAACLRQRPPFRFVVEHITLHNDRSAAGHGRVRRHPVAQRRSKVKQLLLRLHQVVQQVLLVRRQWPLPPATRLPLLLAAFVFVALSCRAGGISGV